MIKVLPDYNGGSILNLSSSIANHFGLDSGFVPMRHELPWDGAERVVLFIADGLGQRQLERHIADGDAPNIAALLGQDTLHHTISSVFPSTTMSAVTSIHMAAPPAKTGWLGYTLWLEEANGVVDMIEQYNLDLSAKLEHPEFLKTHPSLASRLDGLGVQVIAVQPSTYKGSFLNQWYWQGAFQVGYSSSNTIPSQSLRYLEAGKRQYLCIYYPGYDAVCHKYGPSSSQASDEVAAMDLVVARILKDFPKDGKTLFILTADHGQRDLDPKKAVHLERDKILRSMLRGAPAGERLSRTFRVQPDALEELREYLEPYAQTMPTGEAWASGLFGGAPAYEGFRSRVGDLLAVTHEGIQFCWTYPGKPSSSPHLGSHGGWSEAEMLVPVIGLRL
jgi:predicted AlkP superfamily pyrophosphatase or phosphodiesterase